MKINFTALCKVSDEEIARNDAYEKTLGFPKLGVAGRDRLAVVGGGPSIKGRLDDIAKFDGDIWAINGTWKFLQKNGIESTFFSIDPSLSVSTFCKGAKKAVIATCCNPAVFDVLKGSDLSVAKIGNGGIANGPTSATTAPGISIEMGYREVTFFGCESSFLDHVHAYDSHITTKTRRVVVECDGSEFTSIPGYFIQAEFLSELIRSAPNIFKEESGGLLRAMINDPDYNITAASRSIYDAVVA